MLLTGRKFVRKQQFSILIESNIIPFTVYFLACITEQFVNHILKTTLGYGQSSCFDPYFLVIIGEHFNHLVTYIDLIIKIAALQQIKLPIQFGLHVLIGHAGSKVTHNQRTVVTPDHIVWDIGRLRIVEEKTNTVLLVTFHFTGEFFKISYRTVQDGSFSYSVNTGKDIHIGTQIPSYIKTLPESMNFDTTDIVGLLFHNIQFYSRQI